MRASRRASIQLSLRGTATGLTDRVASVQLAVTATTPGGGNVEYQFCDASLVPVFFAYQDGTGGWQPVTGFTSGGKTTFGFNLTQGRGGVLSVFRTSVPDVLAVDAEAPARRSGARASVVRGDRPGPRRATQTVSTSAPALVADVYLTEVLYGSTGELAQDGTDYCALTQPTKTVRGTVAGVPFGQYAIVSLGGSAELFVAGSSTNPVTFTGVADGRVDLVGTRLPAVDAPPDRAIVLRNLEVPDGGSLPGTIDFGGSASAAPATATLTVSGASGHDLEVFTEVVTANSQGLLWFDLSPSPASTRPWAGLNPASMLSGDFHGLYVFAAPPGSSDYRVSLEFTAAVADQTVALGPVINAPTVSQVAAGDYPRLRFQGAFPAEYDKGASIDVVSSADTGNAFAILATGAYLAASGSPLAYDFTMPDVSRIAGFPLAARLTAGANLVAAGAIGFTGTGVFDLRPSLGSELKGATRSTTINVP